MNAVLSGAASISVPTVNNQKLIEESNNILDNIEYIDNSDIKIEIGI